MSRKSTGHAVYQPRPTPDYCDDCRRQRQREQAKLRMQQMRQRRRGGVDVARPRSGPLDAELLQTILDGERALRRSD